MSFANFFLILFTFASSSFAQMGYKEQEAAEKLLANIAAENNRLSGRVDRVKQTIPITDSNVLNTGYRPGTANGVGSLAELKANYVAREQDFFARRVASVKANREFGVQPDDFDSKIDYSSDPDGKRYGGAKETLFKDAQAKFPGQEAELKKWSDEYDQAISRKRQLTFAENSAREYREATAAIQKQYGLTKTIPEAELNKLRRAASQLNVPMDDIDNLAGVGKVKIHGSKKLPSNCFN